MRAGFALVVIGFLAGCQSTRPPVYRETRADLPTRTYVSVQRLAEKLDLEYFGESRGGIEMASPPDYVMLIPDSRNAVVNGQRFALVQKCFLRGSDYVISAGDADLVAEKLATLRHDRPTAPLPPAAPPAKAAPTSGLPPAWRPSASPRDWQAIVIHHAAIPSGSALSIHKVHLGNGWDGLGYHFVIGNGTQSGDGEVEVGFRWRDQIKGAHARAHPGDDNRWNLHSVGVCLVGDFTNVAPSEEQMDALVRLVRALMAEYDIPASNIVPHSFVHATECPGARFPWSSFKSRLR